MAIHSSTRTDVNRSAILARLGAGGPASRAELARVLSLSPALITQLVKDLIADGLIVELEQAPSSGGRPARMLGLAASAGRAIGIKVVADHVALVEVGIDGQVVRSSNTPFDATSSTFVSELVERIRDFIGAGADVNLLGLGVGVPGSVDSPGSGVVDSAQLGWSGVELGDALRRAIGLPVIVENNVNALAVAERLYGLGRSHDDFLVVTIGTGVGAGIVVDGSVLRAASGGAGEIGHIPVTDDGPRCTCGNDGCLEAHISEAALVTQARDAGVIPQAAGIDALLAAADAGDQGALDIFREAGRLLGRTLAGIVHTIDPALVVVLGEGTSAWRHWSPGFEPAFRSRLLRHRRSIPVEVEGWQDQSWAQGAAALVLATPFDAAGAGDQGRLIRLRLVGQAATP
ncbi:sugar kinase [Agromyces rhizosphaerae]|uniref:Sugar kinase n=1 Tax=Agromyces rhizosphaerae TaxID=88374 RepID=A0A9W6CXP9_9MICO|nr:ROK family transcriptional regulator [Agromyces rhizosphaerae]GLI27575.1 sugar kinase [Agromyces rhizosphaerae]